MNSPLAPGGSANNGATQTSLYTVAYFSYYSILQYQILVNTFSYFAYLSMLLHTFEFFSILFFNTISYFVYFFKLSYTYTYAHFYIFLYFVYLSLLVLMHKCAYFCFVVYSFETCYESFDLHLYFYLHLFVHTRFNNHLITRTKIIGKASTHIVGLVNIFKKIYIIFFYISCFSLNLFDMTCSLLFSPNTYIKLF